MGIWVWIEVNEVWFDIKVSMFGFAISSSVVNEGKGKSEMGKDGGLMGDWVGVWK